MEPRHNRNSATNRIEDHGRGPRRRPPSTSSKSSNFVTPQDYEELERHYKFVLPPKKDNNKNDASRSSSTWQQRMVDNYHKGLYKEFAIVDLSVRGRIGLRFRIKQEVVSGKGFRTCGNKGCSSFQQSSTDMVNRDRNMTNEGSGEAESSAAAAGEGLCDYEVPFQYVEQNEQKMELVKLRLCKVCAPLLMERSAESGGGEKPGKGQRAEGATAKRGKGDNQYESRANSSSSSSSSSSDDDPHASTDDRKQRSRRPTRKRKDNERQSSSKSTGRDEKISRRSRKEDPSSDEQDASSSTSSDRHRRHRRRKDRRKQDRKRKCHKKR